jgi:histidinol dehydrogenase
MSYNFLKTETLINLIEAKKLLEKKNGTATDAGNTRIVSDILESIRTGGEKPLLAFSKKYDGFDAGEIGDLKVSGQDLDNAYDDVRNKNPEIAEVIDAAAANIKSYHEEQLKSEAGSWFFSKTVSGSSPDTGSMPGSKNQVRVLSAGERISDSEMVLGQKVSPMDRVGLYIPGGRYIYPSSVLMSAIPARIACVKEIVVCTPPQKDGKINDILLYIFSILGIREIYKIGGAQAIGLMAYGIYGTDNGKDNSADYGTEFIKKVDKIVGPGNIYVTIAKKLVYGQVGIDSLAGPSEVVVIADKSADPAFVAADLLAQAEHDPDARCILLSSDKGIAADTIKNIYLQIDILQAKFGDRMNIDLMVRALKNNCRIFYNPDPDFLTDLSNFIAPEHLEIITGNFEKTLEKISNAGAIFLGNFSPVAIGDYMCGTNHIIPTSGNARFSSPLGVGDFLKRSSIAYYGKKALQEDKDKIELFADYENLLAHKNSVSLRFKK